VLLGSRKHTYKVNAVALGKVDGQPVVVSGSGDETVRLWDARTGRPPLNTALNPLQVSNCT